MTKRNFIYFPMVKTRIIYVVVLRAQISCTALTAVCRIPHRSLLRCAVLCFAVLCSNQIVSLTHRHPLPLLSPPFPSPPSHLLSLSLDGAGSSTIPLLRHGLHVCAPPRPAVCLLLGRFSVSYPLHLVPSGSVLIEVSCSLAFDLQEV